MKNTIIQFGLLPCLMALFAASCEKDVVHRFEEQASLCFYWDIPTIGAPTQRDSLNYSFFLGDDSVVQDTVWIDVRLTGMPSSTPRQMPFSQINTGKANAAIAGTHYIAFDDPRFATHMVFPAGKVAMMFPVVMLRTAEMRTKEFRLEIGIGTNEHFTTGIYKQTSFLVKFNDYISEPPTWYSAYFNYAFGTWGAVKMKFIIEYVGLTDFETMLGSDIRNYYGAQARQKLIWYEETYGPLYEDDGTRVSFDD